MNENDKPDPYKQTFMGHIRLLPKVLFFAMVAYGFIKILIWISVTMGWQA